MKPIILGSASPRRRELLEQIGISFTIFVPHTEETLRPGLTPEEQVCSLSRQKAAAVAAETGDTQSVILTADTLVFLEGTPLGKPAGCEEAAETLRRLSGRTHTVCTGVTVQQGERIVTGAVSTQVTFRPLTEENIARYVATGEPMDKAGSYGIQGRGGVFVTAVQGDYTNVIGLPLPYTAGVLADFGVTPFGRLV